MRARTNLWRLALAVLLVFQLIEPGSAATSGETRLNTRFVAIGFHDVVEPGQPADFDSVTVDKLVTFLDWLKADGWTPISAADVSAAAHERKSLPAKAIVLTFDDGYVSFYNRVYPLLLAYHYPAVLSLVGEWMEQPSGTMVDYGGRQVPREHFLTWDQVRRMRASGLVEVASHTYDLHQTVLINSQGNRVGAPRAWLFENSTDLVETDQQHIGRIRADLERSKAIIERETGVTPHVLVWPYGRFSGPGTQVAQSLGFDQIYNLTPEAADARNSLQIGRYYPTRDPDLGEIVENLKFGPVVSPTIRAACVDLSGLAAASSPTQQDAVLGSMIEELRRLGPNIVIIDPLRYSSDGSRPVASWLPTSRLPVERDVYSRAARQLGLRAGVDVYVRLRLDPLVATLGEEATMDLARQAARLAPITGLALDGDGGPAFAGSPFDPVAARLTRASADVRSPLAIRVIGAAMEIDPQLRLMIMAHAPGSGPPEGADMIVWPAAPDIARAGAQAEQLKNTGWFNAGASGRVLLSVPAVDPKRQVQAIRVMEARGANSIALCPWSPADSDKLAPAFSAAAFPFRP